MEIGASNFDHEYIFIITLLHANTKKKIVKILQEYLNIKQGLTNMHKQRTNNFNSISVCKYLLRRYKNTLKKKTIFVGYKSLNIAQVIFLIKN